MKQTKKFLCILLTAFMVVSACGSLLISAAEYTLVENADKAYAVADGVQYSEYTISSGVYDNVSVSASVLEFNVEDYMVMVYSGTAGGAAVLERQYQLATEAGYEVVGMINGSFFSMDTGNYGSYGTLVEYDVSNGILISGDANNPANSYDGALCIFSDGTMESVSNSELGFHLSFNGVEAKDMLATVNKTGGFNSNSSWHNLFYYYDSHSGDWTASNTGEKIVAKALTYEICPGYEIICKKLNKTDLTIGGTLEGEIVEIRENSYGAEIAEDEFVLFMRSDSPNASLVEGLKVGDAVSIYVEEKVAASAELTTKANSVIENVNYLVKDGVNLTLSDSFNSTAAHPLSTQARWTAFGVKEDGSWVFFTTEGASTGSAGSVTMKDVAAAMIELGCTTVVRMDGGGSSAMYVCDTGSGKPGYLQSSTRAVADCIMVVKRTSPALNGESKADLEALVAENASKTGKAYEEALAEANSVLTAASSVSGDYQRAYQGLYFVTSAYASLDTAIAQAEAVDKAAYSPSIWEQLQNSLAIAKELQTDTDASARVIADTASTLSTAVGSTGIYECNVALGCTYTSSLTASDSYPDTDGKELTDGSYSSETDGMASGWSGYSGGNPVFVVDLGTECDGLSGFNARFLMLKSWGIQTPTSVSVSISSDGTNFTSVGTALPPENLDRTVDGVSYDYTLKLEETVSARYVKFEVVKYGSWTFISELEVTRQEVPYGTIDTVKGDVDGNGKLDAMDYMKLKRHVLGTYVLTDEERARADVDNSGKIDSKDYMMVKRAYLGTYEFPNT